MTDPDPSPELIPRAQTRAVPDALLRLVQSAHSRDMAHGCGSTEVCAVVRMIDEYFRKGDKS
jgi:hypothetical protein